MAISAELQLPPLDLLSRMAPLACLQMTFFAFASGEVARLQSNWEELSKGWALWLVALTGVGSFSLNLCSLQANKVTSPLTLSIMANVKQVGAVLCDGLMGGWVGRIGMIAFALIISTLVLWALAKRDWLSWGFGSQVVVYCFILFLDI